MLLVAVINISNITCNQIWSEIYLSLSSKKNSWSLSN